MRRVGCWRCEGGRVSLMGNYKREDIISLINKPEAGAPDAWYGWKDEYIWGICVGRVG